MEKLNENVRARMLGLLPFDTESFESFTPKEYLKKVKDEKGEDTKVDLFPKEYRPIFDLKAFTKTEKNEVGLLASSLEKVNIKEKLEINTKLLEIIRKKVINVSNLFDLGKDAYVDCPIDKEYNCVDLDLWERLPEIIKTSLYLKIANISGIISNENLAL